MTGELFLVVRHDFDSWENRNPWSQEVVGYATSRAEADAWIETARASERSFRGWDGSTYPSWSVTPVKPIRAAQERK